MHDCIGVNSEERGSSVGRLNHAVGSLKGTIFTRAFGRTMLRELERADSDLVGCLPQPMLKQAVVGV